MGVLAIVEQLAELARLGPGDDQLLPQVAEVALADVHPAAQLLEQRLRVGEVEGAVAELLLRAQPAAPLAVEPRTQVCDLLGPHGHRWDPKGEPPTPFRGEDRRCELVVLPVLAHGQPQRRGVEIPDGMALESQESRGGVDRHVLAVLDVE